jgi:ketosteroid isomerase-like protein
MPQSSSDAATYIREAVRRRVRRIREQDMDAMVEDYYADDAVFMPPRQAEVRGRDALLEYWRARPDEGLIELELEPDRIETSGELAYEVGHYTSILRPRHGALLQDYGKYLTVYRRQADGSWKAVADTFNTDRD